ncbi:MAG: dockerin type I repeat-containing protein [Phycisphaerae bacterium]
MKQFKAIAIATILGSTGAAFAGNASDSSTNGIGQTAARTVSNNSPASNNPAVGDTFGLSFPIVFSGSGPDAVSIQATVDAFRDALGNLNRADPGSRNSGRREINWDGVPDAFSSPNAFPGDFFNAPTFPRARGAEFSTPGTELQVSATLTSGVDVEFGNFGSFLADQFVTFSPERLFAPIDSTTTFVDFFVPGTSVPATSHGFGAVFTGVDVQGFTTIELFDLDDFSLGVWDVAQGPAQPETLSFLGISFDAPVIAYVKITTGNLAITAEGGGDAVAMDDFIYGEPIGVFAAGDMNCDGEVNSGDVSAFVLALIDPTSFASEFQDCAFSNADVNGDGAATVGDISAFIALLASA